MALTPMKVAKPGRSSGGGVGSVIGGALGAVAGFVTGGPAGAAAGWNVGSSVGGTVGNVAAPAKGPSVTQAPVTAIDRRLDEPPKYSESQILEQSLMALKDAPREVKQEYRDPLLKAYELSLRKEGRFG